jgi:glycosyltransferase involved in cell wall biosynthesis
VYRRFRSVERERREGLVTVHHPRFLTGPGTSTHRVEDVSYALGIDALVARLFRERRFDLIHAHFAFPDGVVAGRLGSRYGVPVLVTEHALWRPWMDAYPGVARVVAREAGRVRFRIAVSRAVKDGIVAIAGHEERVRVIPVGVDGEAFPLKAGKTDSEHILFVGHITLNKGVDLLLGAFARIASARPAATLTLVGGGPYPGTRDQEDELRTRAAALGFGERIRFLGSQPPEEVARRMRESAVLVLPSRRESFGAVLVEALASGTPVVATRCGGPEDVITEENGVLVEASDEAALARGIDRVVSSPDRYEPARLRDEALARFSWARVASETESLYDEALSGRAVSA